MALTLTPQRMAILKVVITSSAVEDLIGAERWDLTEDEEDELWLMIKELKGEE